MDIYVDKLPESCEECKFMVDDVRINNLFCILIMGNISSHTKKKDCPLKELTNAQLAIGWYQEGKEVYSLIDGGINDFRTSTSIHSFLKEKWYFEEKPKYTFTNWKGAREAVKAGKKVTFKNNEEYVLQCNDGVYRLFWKALLLADKLTDTHYDSNKWKVWE